MLSPPVRRNVQVLTLYHGTSKSTADSIQVRGFRATSGNLGLGIYAYSSKSSAKKHGGAIVFTVEISLSSPKQYNSNSITSMMNWAALGYDCAFVNRPSGGLKVLCVKASSQVRTLKRTNPEQRLTLYFGTRGNQATNIENGGFAETDGKLGRGIYLSSTHQEARKHGDTVFSLSVLSKRPIKLSKTNDPLQRR